MVGAMRNVAVVALLSACLFAHDAIADAVIPDLYTAQTIVTGEREETRLPGFAECFDDVLVKVSGDPRLIGDPRVAALAGSVAGFVAEFRYHDRMAGIPHHDEQGTRDRPYDLWVRFDAAKIDAALRGLGRKPWPAARPRLTVFLAMRNLTTGYVVAEDGDRPLEREALLAAGARRGVPLRLPSLAMLAEAGLGFDAFAGADAARLAALAKSHDGDLALVGRMAWSDEASRWIGDWRIEGADKSAAWQVRSLTFDDGFRQAIGGAAQFLSGNGSPG
jgi:hypothetical protein